MSCSPGSILKACEMHFNGMSNSEIAKHFDVDESTVSRWRKRKIWIDFKNELIAVFKASVLRKHTSYSAEIEYTAQG